MGGADKFCEKLNFAFEQARDLDFVYAYSGGYVSYANQPGCSNAHIFAYGGKPWLTQYWVRQVKKNVRMEELLQIKGTVVMMKMKVKWEGSVH